MDFYILCQNSLPVVIAVTVILISIYFLQRNSKCHKAVQEVSESNNENMKSLTDDKVGQFDRQSPPFEAVYLLFWY